MLHHVEIYVSDLARSRAFWQWLLCEELGYKVHQEWPKGIDFSPLLAGGQGGASTYIVFVQTEQKHLDAGYNRCRTGLNHLAFHAQSREQVDDLTAKLRSRGITILYEDRHPYAGGPDYYAVFFEDPDRIKVEVAAP